MLSPAELEAVTTADTFCSEKMTRIRATVDSEWPQRRSVKAVDRTPDRITFAVPQQFLVDRFTLLDRLRPLFESPAITGKLLYASIEVKNPRNPQ